ncbi:transglutaminase family protein [Sphingobium phenoxybenzoativorans]|uniref:transglutaminase family protein n=1 Tax=Sphingobium phenoxybenzoativorans TaxID=1592790 RepID=UPI0009F6CBAE|nr:transglutaminase family protein [Sphingobium phenoxybenzoativorans]
MKLRIRHDTIYRYRRAVSLQPHRLMLVPRSSHDLIILSSSLELSPNADMAWAQDVFGNLVAAASFAFPTDLLAISSKLLVEQQALAWPIYRIAPGAHSYPFGYSDGEMADLGALLHPQHDDPEELLATWARSFVLGPTVDTLSLLKNINAGIADAVAYRTRDEEGTQSPLETLSIASGSCRDMSALFIDAVRHLGFGARAVSGYLHDPDVSPDDAGSTHAWAEVYLPAAGWIAFDPTHRRVGSANLIPVAVGRCNTQIMPVTGGYAGAAEDFSGMEVRVTVEEV